LASQEVTNGNWKRKFRQRPQRVAALALGKRVARYVGKLAAKNSGQIPFKTAANLPFGSLN